MKNQNLKLAFRRIVIYLLILAGLMLILNLPAKTKQAIDGVVTVKTIPLYVKTCGFLYRDYQYKSLSRQITNGITADRDRVMAIYDWTVKNIEKKPRGFPTVDDHILNIVVRRYGTRGQMADVFTSLASYAGYESFMHKLKLKVGESSTSILLSFVKVDGAWHVFDVDNRKSFISAEDESALTPNGPTYGEYLRTIDKTTFGSHIRRPDKQKIVPRFVYEFKKIFVGDGAEDNNR